MPANQTYSTRIHSRRQLGRSIEHLQAVTKVLLEIHHRYETALPRVSAACVEMIQMLTMIENMVEDIRQNI